MFAAGNGAPRESVNTYEDQLGCGDQQSFVAEVAAEPRGGVPGALEAVVEVVAVGVDVADLPAGANRLIRSAPGLKGVWVNGVQVFDGEDYVKVKPPGQVLRSFSTARPTLAMPYARAAE